MIDTHQDITQYTTAQFISLIAELIEASGSATYQDQLLEQFIEVSAHPSGSDLIYHCASGQQESAEDILKHILAWRASQAMQGLKPE